MNTKTVVLLQTYETALGRAKAGIKPNRAQRRTLTFGVKAGNNRKMTASRKALGSLRRSRVNIESYVND